MAIKLDDPVVLEIKPPKTPFKLPKLPSFNGSKTTKIITIVSASVIILSLIIFGIFTYLGNSSAYKKTHNITNATDEIAFNSTPIKSDAALPGGGSVVGRGGTSGTNSPVVTLSASQAAVPKGGKVTLSWSVTNNPKSCIASDDWSGVKEIKGSEESSALTTLQTYLFTLTCKTDTGTGFSTVSVNAIEQGGTGTIDRPTVTIATLPSRVYNGQSSTISWSATGSPSSCSASGDWSGTKSANGSTSTGQLTQSKKYSYTLTCNNSSGSGYAIATIEVSDPPPDVPLVSISSNPIGPITPGNKVTLSWSATNNPSSCIASGDWSGAKPASGTQQTTALNTIQVYGFTLTCENNSGSNYETVTVQVLPNIPSVSITASPTSIYKGSTAAINWSATNNPTLCEASGDWTGTKSASGSTSTGSLNSIKTYTFYLRCDNDGGSSATMSATVNVTLPPKPVVTIDVSPISVTTGGSASISWSATNNPTSCNASGDWTGTKSSSGAVGTGTLNIAKTYTYTLTCSNDGGISSASTTVTATSGGPVTQPPVVTISASPTTIGSGSSSTISWSATNSPTSCTASGNWSGAKAGSGSTSTGTMNTAGTYTYTLACSNSAGTDTKSATVIVIAIPVVTISVSPASINSGGSATITWSVSNTPTSCTAGGAWTGTKAASGSQSTGTISSAGSYTYSLSCTNSGGTGTASATLTATNPTPVYCGGLLPCYGPTTLALHATTNDCWSYQTSGASSVLYNMTGFAPRHSGGTTTILTTANCGKAINWAGAPSNGKHTAAKSNTQATLNGYRVGYYDATKP